MNINQIRQKGQSLNRKLLLNKGCVARNLKRMLEACNLTVLFNLDSHSKQAGEECRLLHAVSLKA
jgi:hypothetical protein